MSDNITITKWVGDTKVDFAFGLTFSPVEDGVVRVGVEEKLTFIYEH